MGKSKPGPKLNPEARRLVVRSIIAGDTNAEIRKKLQNAGYPADLNDSAFSPYRQADEVVEAIARKDAEAVQSGYAQRSERILKLAKSAKRFERMLAPDNETDDFNLSSRLDLSKIHKEYRETVRDIGDLVDPAKKQDVNVNLDSEIAGLLEEVARTREAKTS